VCLGAIAGAVKGKAGKALGAIMDVISKRDVEMGYLMERELRVPAKLFSRDYA
jgi:hypothetical protein